MRSHAVILLLAAANFTGLALAAAPPALLPGTAPGPVPAAAAPPPYPGRPFWLHHAPGPSLPQPQLEFVPTPPPQYFAPFYYEGPKVQDDHPENDGNAHQDAAENFDRITHQDDETEESRPIWPHAALDVYQDAAEDFDEPVVTEHEDARRMLTSSNHVRIMDLTWTWNLNVDSDAWRKAYGDTRWRCLPAFDANVCRSGIVGGPHGRRGDFFDDTVAMPADIAKARVSKITLWAGPDKSRLTGIKFHYNAVEGNNMKSWEVMHGTVAPWVVQYGLAPGDYIVKAAFSTCKKGRHSRICSASFKTNNSRTVSLGDERVQSRVVFRAPPFFAITAMFGSSDKRIDWVGLITALYVR